MALPKKLRIYQQKDFEYLQKCGKKIILPFGWLKFAKNRYGFNRLAVIVSKNEFKKAHLRNKIRRTITEAFRTYKSIPEGQDILVVAKKNALDYPFLQIGPAIKEALSKQS